MGEYRKAPITELETRRLLLRPLVESDAARIQLFFPHLSVLRYMSAEIPWPYPDDGAITFVKSVLPHMDAGTEYLWAILRKEALSDGLVGVISLDPGSDEANRGFWLAEAYWGSGYMTEAMTAVNDFGFGVLEMSEIIVSNAVPNIASSRLKERSGAVIVGTEDVAYVGGTFPSYRWRLTAEAWAENRHRFP